MFAPIAETVIVFAVTAPSAAARTAPPTCASAEKIAPAIVPPPPPSIVETAWFAALWPASTLTAPETVTFASGPIEASLSADEPIVASPSPPPPPAPSATKTTCAFAVAWFDVRERTVSDAASTKALGSVPSKLAFVRPPAVADGIITTIERPTENELPSAIAVAWFADVASTCTATPGAWIVEVEPTSAWVEASEVTSASDDAPPPAPSRPAEKMSAVALAVFADVAWTSTEPALSASPSNSASVAPPTFAVGRFTASEMARLPDAASELAVAVFTEAAVTETEPCAKAVEPVRAVTSAALVICASEPAPEKLSRPAIPKDFVVDVAVLWPFASTVRDEEVIEPSTAASTAPATIALVWKTPPAMAPPAPPLAVAVAALSPVCTASIVALPVRATFALEPTEASLSAAAVTSASEVIPTAERASPIEMTCEVALAVFDVCERTSSVPPAVTSPSR